MKGLTTSCRIRVNADGDWEIMPPVSQITKIGDAVSGFLPPITRDDLLVTGQLGSMDRISGGNGIAAEGDSEVTARVVMALIGGVRGWSHEWRLLSEELIIPVGQGSAGVTTGWMVQPNCIVQTILARVIQAPGGGATTFSISRHDTTTDKLIENVAVALNGTFDSTADSDGTHDGPFYNGAYQMLKVKTNANVTGSDMKLRIGISYIELWNFDD